jgi:Flp pilus assembly pilin Flp
MIRGYVTIRGYVKIRAVWHFLANEDGQDLIEYTLLLAFVMFTIVGLAVGMKASIQGITSTSTSQINYANTMVS